MKACVISGMFIIAAILGAGYAAHSDKNHADSLVAALRLATPGITQEADVRRMVSDRSSNLDARNECAANGLPDCDQFGFSNRWLAKLHVAPAKYVWVTLNYKNGVLVKKSVQYAEEPKVSAVSRQTQVMDIVPRSVSTKEDRSVSLNLHFPDRAIAIVEDNELVPFEVRTRDWEVNLSCLEKLTVCQDPREILSGAFPRASTR